MSLKLSHSRGYHNLLDDAVNSELTTLNNSTKADLWKKMGVELEIEGVPKKEISTIVRKDIEDKLYHSESAELKEFTPRQDYKWHNGYYWRVMKQCNYTNPEMARNGDMPILGWIPKYNKELEKLYPNVGQVPDEEGEYHWLDLFASWDFKQMDFIEEIE